MHVPKHKLQIPFAKTQLQAVLICTKILWASVKLCIQHRQWHWKSAIVTLLHLWNNTNGGGMKKLAHVLQIIEMAVCQWCQPCKQKHQPLQRKRWSRVLNPCIACKCTWACRGRCLHWQLEWTVAITFHCCWTTPLAVDSLHCWEQRMSSMEPSIICWFDRARHLLSWGSTKGRNDKCKSKF